MKILVSSGLLRQLGDYGRMLLPREACGIILGHRCEPGENGWRAVDWRPICNDAVYSNAAFSLAPEQWVRYACVMDSQRGADDSGLRLLGVFHTHPDTPAFPSASDLGGWLAGDSVTSWIISYANPDGPQIRAFRIDRNGCREIPLIEWL